MQVLATTTLAEVEGILHEETMTISRTVATLSHATGTHNNPSLASIGPVVPEAHTSMTAALKHLKSHQVPPSTNLSPGCSAAPAVQAIVVNCVSIVEPQLAPIIRMNLEVVTACPEDSQAACPTHSKVITSRESRPPLTCVGVVHHLAPPSHVGFATLQVLTTATLTKVINIFPEDSVTIVRGMVEHSPSTCTNNSPPVASVRTSVPEQHASMTTFLEHLKLDEMPSRAKVLVGFPIAPAMQTIIVDCETIVNPQLAAII
jgi:hypothetical protein